LIVIAANIVLIIALIAEVFRRVSLAAGQP
jgi:hypothetical protein